MPAGSAAKLRCWNIRSKLEKILIISTAIACIIIIILAILLSNKPAHEVSPSCDTTVCLNEAAKVAQYIDSKIDPCENFYQFACGNFLKRSHGDESYRFTNQLEDIGKREALEIYMELPNKNDHFMVKMAKKLFESCINENALVNENLRSIKESIADAGGWPVLEGDKWDERKFDWLKSTYKLRKLGYHFSAFLDLTVEPEADSYLLKVKLPDVFDYSSLTFNKLDFMVETALIFGAADRSKVESEMKETLDFLQALQLEVHTHYNLGNFSVYTVGRYQQKYGALDWIQFLNNLTEPVLKVKRNDTVIFPSPLTLKSWIDLIQRTPKRIQANYFMWIVIEKCLQYLPDKFLNYHNAWWKKKITIQEKCLERIHDKFTPNPIDILCDRRYLPAEKRHHLEQFIETVKTELVKVMQNIKGTSDENRKKMVEKAKNVKIVIGQPEDYFVNKILDDIAVDVPETKDVSFLGLIAQANRNKQSFLYSTVVNSNSRQYDKWYVKSAAQLPIYNVEDNVLYVSTLVTENFIYDENRPDYLNYGVLGVAIGQQLSTLPFVGFGKYLTTLNETLYCIKEAQKPFKVTLDNFLASRVAQYALGTEISYSAYEANIKDERNLPLIGTKYTSKQNFWISTASILCEPLNRYSAMHPSVVSGMVSGFIRNHPQFSNDFKCAIGSKMNPATSVWKRMSEFWEKSTQTQRLLIISLIALIALVIILIGTIVHYRTLLIWSCHDVTCVHEASRIIKRTNMEAKPCTEFYKFACKNSYKYIDESEDQRIAELHNFLYENDVNDTDTLKLSKILYKKCITEMNSELSAVVKNGIKLFDGWPILEEKSSDKFNWVDSVYKVQSLGIPLDIFLGITIDLDSFNTTVLKVSVPQFDKVSTFENNQKTWRQISIDLGARESLVENAISETKMFLEKRNDNKLEYTVVTINDLQLECGNLNWVHFIEKFVGFNNYTSSTTLIAADMPSINKRLRLLSSTPRHILANYLMWKVMENLESFSVKFKDNNSHKQFCAKTLSQALNFKVSDIVNTKSRQFKIKTEMVKSLAKNIVNTYIISLKANRRAYIDVESFTDKLENVTLIVGPGNIDIQGIKLNSYNNLTFLELVLQCNRLKNNWLFSKLENQYLKPWHVDYTLEPKYYQRYNTLYVPSSMTIDSVFNEVRPNYINYGSLGPLIAYPLTKFVHENLVEKEIWRNQITCFEKMNLSHASETLTHVVSVRESRTAYEAWMRNHRREQKLIHVDLDPAQLFWISAAPTLCKTSSPSLLSEISEFNYDFRCPQTSGICKLTL
ncbi:hypothetical protein FQR65_LT06866 [Abscondita terminalis]|nr:hypothetical protein FQR65_LT06866 [Abscondita terminalis]